MHFSAANFAVLFSSIPGKSCGEAEFDIEPKGTAKQKRLTRISVGVALKSQAVC